MVKWNTLNEADKARRVNETITELNREGIKVTGASLAERLGVTSRTGRTYLTKLKPEVNSPAPSTSSKKIKHVVIMPDVQVPLHNRDLVDKFIRFVHEYQPDALGQVGDFTDSTQLGRWVEGMKEQFDGNLQRDFDMSMDILRRIREGYSGPFHMSRSNHDDRLSLKIRKTAPELESLRDLTIERQLRLEDFDVQFHHQFVNIAPGWIMGHGDEGSMSSVPGQTAYKLALQTGMNVVCGHTHRLGIYTTSHGYNGEVQYMRQGMEVGNFMDMKKATYLKGGKANWQAGFGILHISGDEVYPETIPVLNGNFVVNGVQY